jgi:hypothetical protein
MPVRHYQVDDTMEEPIESRVEHNGGSAKRRKKKRKSSKRKRRTTKKKRKSSKRKRRTTKKKRKTSKRKRKTRSKKKKTICKHPPHHGKCLTNGKGWMVSFRTRDGRKCCKKQPKRALGRIPKAPSESSAARKAWETGAKGMTVAEHVLHAVS